MKPFRTYCLAGLVLLISGCGEPPLEPPKLPPPEPEPAAPAPAKAIPLLETIAPPVRELQVTNGMSERAVVEALGAPSGMMTSGGLKMLLYSGAQVELIDDRVVNLDPDFVRNVQAARKEATQKAKFESKQRARGLVFYDGEWMKLRKKEKISAQRREREQVEKRRREARDALYRSFAIRDQKGKPIDHSRLLSRGRITVIDFYADWCGPCRKLAPHLETLARRDRAVALKKVDIVNWGSATAQQYNIRSVPNVRVFDRQGRLMGPPTHSLSTIRQYVEAAKRR